MTTSPAEPPESTLADPGVCWRGECRSGCYYTDGCSLGNTTRLTPTAARIAQLEADLAAAKAKALNDAADALEGALGVEGTPRDLYGFRLWLRARAALTTQPAP